MGKLSELILNENIRRSARQRSGKAGNVIATKLGRHLYGGGLYPEIKNTKEKKIPDPIKVAETVQKRKDTIAKKLADGEELIKLRTENELIKKQADELKQQNIKDEQEKAKIESENNDNYEKAIEYNTKRENEYNANKLAVKKHEKIQTKEEKPRSSGLIDTTVRSLGY